MHPPSFFDKSLSQFVFESWQNPKRTRNFGQPRLTDKVWYAHLEPKISPHKTLGSPSCPIFLRSATFATKTTRLGILWEETIWLARRPFFLRSENHVNKLPLPEWLKGVRHLVFGKKETDRHGSFHGELRSQSYFKGTLRQQSLGVFSTLSWSRMH